MSKVELRTTEDVRLWLERWARALDEPSVDPVRVIAAGKIGEVIRLVVKRSAVATVPDPPLAVEDKPKGDDGPVRSPSDDFPND